MAEGRGAEGGGGGGKAESSLVSVAMFASSFVGGPFLSRKVFCGSRIIKRVVVQPRICLRLCRFAYLFVGCEEVCLAFDGMEFCVITPAAYQTGRGGSLRVDDLRIVMTEK